MRTCRAQPLDYAGEARESVCDALGADVIYNSGMQWQLDDFPSCRKYPVLRLLVGEITNLLKRQIGIGSIRRQVYGRTKAEEWCVVNTAVHFNELG